MEKWSFSEQVLLGYNSRDSIGNRSFSVNPSPRTSCQNSDANRRALDSINPSMDFHDVFGGPPRCSFVREPRYSLNEACGDDSGLLKQEALQSQKHVFGEDSPKRRNHLREDFFGDIFGGQDSSRTPRRISRDPFGSLPASRMQSPIFPSRPKSITIIGSSSQPPELSLPSKIGKRIDYSTLSSPPSGSHSSYKHKPDASNSFGSSSSPSVLSPKVMAFDNSSSRFQIQPVQAHNDSRNETRTTYRQSPLSNQFSLNCEDGSSEAPESASRNLERPDSDNQFHFSIHKWASKGITLLMPAKGGDRSKDRETNETKVSISPKAVFLGADIPCGYENSSIISRDSKKKENFLQQESKTPSAPSGKPEIVEKLVPASPQASRRTQLNSLRSLLKENNKEPGTENRPHSIISNGRPDNNLSEGIWKEVPVSVQEEHGSELKNHDNLANDKSDEHGKETIVSKAGKKEGKLKRSTSSNTRKVAETTSSTVQDLPANPEARVLGSRVKGKVKEFVEIFNQETSQKSTPKVDTKNRSPRVKDAVAHNVEAQITSNTAKSDEEEKMANGDKNTARMDSTIVADEILRESEQADLDIDFIVHHIDDSSIERIDITLPCFESTQESCGDNANNAEAPRRGNLQKNCQVEQILEGQKQNPQMGQDQELHINDTKIRNWSKGKEGNIRSLLSTLQYVLWPNSGWKPIALVDIIEGNSVKRAYQKALLCLHPDKLQQKGVTVLQKHIAEQVFGILQEAWTEFNSVGSF